MPEPHTRSEGASFQKDRETRNRILTSAEELFFQHDSADFSLRELTRHAGVSLATVNYHFGSKENLFLALLIKAEEQIYSNRLEQLAAARQNKGTTEQRLRQLLRSLIEPVLGDKKYPDMGKLYMAMIARSSSEAPEELARTLTKQSSHLHRHFLAAKTLLPDLSAEDLVWRLYFVLSIEYGVHRGHGHLGNLCGKTDSPTGEEIVDRVLDFVIPGIMAKASRKPVRQG